MRELKRVMMTLLLLPIQTGVITSVVMLLFTKGFHIGLYCKWHIM